MYHSSVSTFAKSYLTNPSTASFHLNPSSNFLTRIPTCLHSTAPQHPSLHPLPSMPPCAQYCNTSAPVDSPLVCPSLQISPLRFDPSVGRPAQLSCPRCTWSVVSVCLMSPLDPLFPCPVSQSLAADPQCSTHSYRSHKQRKPRISWIQPLSSPWIWCSLDWCAKLSSCRVLLWFYSHWGQSVLAAHTLWSFGRHPLSSSWIRPWVCGDLPTRRACPLSPRSSVWAGIGDSGSWFLKRCLSAGLRLALGWRSRSWMATVAAGHTLARSMSFPC